MSTHRGSPGRAALVATVNAAVLGPLLRTLPPGGADRWRRTNHAGATVTLLEGPTFVVAASSAALADGDLAAAVAGIGAGAFGAVDDLAGDSGSKGLRGHLGALRQGRVTTGVVKIAGLALTGLAAAVVADRQARARRPARRRPGAEEPSALVAGLTSAAEVLVGGAVVAGSANLANLLDLRPGRALKATLLVGVPLGISGSVAAGAASGAALGCLPGDLAGETMLGDSGANAAGAMLGAAALKHTRLPGRLAILAVLTGLTLASEKVSFTRVIESTPVLRQLDALGRPAADDPDT